MNLRQIESKIREGKPGRYRIETGLYLRVYDETSGHFIARYTYLKKRKEIALGKFSKQGDGLTLSEARDKHVEIKKHLKKGHDPLEVKKRGEKLKLTRVNDVAKDWLKTCDQRLENPQIPRRIYKKDIAPTIGEQSINQVSPPDILFLLRKINDSGRPTIANDALGYLKKLFNHAIKLGLITSNPAIAFSIHDAGGAEKKGTRALTFTEIPIVLKVLHQHHLQFTRENYLTIILLLCLGVRKTELTAAKWQEFNLEEQIWALPAERTKTNESIKMPISSHLMPIFKELKLRACGSEYLFPSRKNSKRRDYISDDTINHALKKMFGFKRKDRKNESTPNIMGEHGIQPFTPHDLRRTFRSLLSENGVDPYTAERCLNHKIRGVAGVYDRHDYFKIRKEAMDVVAEQIIGLAPGFYL